MRQPYGSRTTKVHLSLRPCDRVGRVDLKRFKSKNDFVDEIEQYHEFLLSLIISNRKFEKRTSNFQREKCQKIMCLKVKI